MRDRLLGRSGLRVSELCLRAMVFGHRRATGGHLASLETDLDPDELRRLDEASRVPLGFPATLVAHARLRVLPIQHGWPRSWMHFRAPDGFDYELVEDPTR